MRRVGSVFWGLILISIAVVLIMNQMGLISGTIGVGTVIVGLFCLACLVSSLAKRNLGGILFSLGIAWIGLGQLIGLPVVSPAMVFLIGVILFVGLHVLFPGLGRKKIVKTVNFDKEWKSADDGFHGNKHQTLTEQEKDGYFYVTNSFGETAKYLNSDDFKGAELTSSFGEMKVYFDAATIIHEPVTISVNNSFGEMQLFIPSEWNVKMNVGSFAGEVSEYKRESSSSSPVVNLVGQNSFGAIKVNYI